MENKKIIILIVVILLAFIGYKLVAAKIQENKEKAVLQERARLDELAKAPLDACIEETDKWLDYNLKLWKGYYYDMFTEKFQYDCQNLDGHLPYKGNTKEYCTPPSDAEFKLELQAYRDEAADKKQECYKRYK